MFKIVSNSGAVWTVASFELKYAESILQRLQARFHKASKDRFNFRLVEVV